MTNYAGPEIERRDFFAAMAMGAAAVGGMTLGAQQARANWGLIAPGPVPDEDFDGRLLINKPRAYEVMEQEGLDGIVALNPVNIFYLGNYISYETQMLRAVPSFAVMPRDPTQPSFLIVSTADLWFIANAKREHPEIIAYGVPGSWEEYRNPELWGQEPQTNSFTFSNGINDRLTDIERGWVEIDQRWESGKAPSPEWALIRALNECGLLNGRIGCDDMRIAHILAALGQTGVTCVPGDNTFRKIRMIKSDVELAHMRRVANINRDACLAMLARIELGMTKEVIDEIFLAEAAQRGSKAVWIAAGTIGGLRHGHVVEGEAMLVDAVSQTNYYHGDFGRTWCMGEPTREMQERARLTQLAAEIAQETMRPGLRYSELSEAIARGVKNASRSGWTMGVSPHSVGLQHTDQPYRDGLPFVVRDDLVLQENMTITVDLPQIELGWGATHYEDLIQITSDGALAMTEVSEPLIVV
ncbi:M24 family metallopeptidase [Altererythrobacter sp. GH1-8]|uniref:M24 family metallopeptidase n=1 Tax=Altererythrobacter sp. GH1-8 TaxID=3349333 RepID=UPI00374D4D94